MIETFVTDAVVVAVVMDAVIVVDTIGDLQATL